MAVVFNHRVMHEGQVLLSKDKRKYFMRSEIMFRNMQPPGPSLSKRDEEALMLVQDADYLEFDGRANEAAKCWSKAFKMSSA